MKTRIYALRNVETKKVERLVRAGSRTASRAHAARKTWTADLATQDDLVEALGAGIKVEDADVGDTTDLGDDVPT